MFTRDTTGRGRRRVRRFESLENRWLLHGDLVGEWRGTTSQGEEISFTVVDHEITQLSFGGTIAGTGCSSHVNSESTGNLAAVDNDHHFSRLSRGGPGALTFDIAGVFASDDDATGSLRLTMERPIPGFPGCPGTVDLTWQATKDPGDVNGDHQVDLTDFGLLKEHFGGPGSRRDGDLNADGRIDLSDFGILKANFGRVPAAPPELITDSPDCGCGTDLLVPLAARRSLTGAAFTEELDFDADRRPEFSQSRGSTRVDLAIQSLGDEAIAGGLEPSSLRSDR